jgi:hypothetical protein
VVITQVAVVVVWEVLHLPMELVGLAAVALMAALTQELLILVAVAVAAAEKAAQTVVLV